MRRPRPRDGSAAEPLGPAFTNVFTANLTSSLGDGIARVAAPLLAVRLTDDPLLVSGVAAVAMLPWLFFAIPAGILLDRVDRRRALGVANTVRAALAVLLLVLAATDALTIWWLYLVIFAYGALETVYDGAIRAVVPSIVPRRGLPRANSRIEAGEIVVQQFVSGPITSALFAVAVVVPLGVGALSYAVAALLALWLPAAAAGEHRTAPPTEATAWYRQVADGFRYIVGHPMLKPLWLLSTFIGLCFSAATATLALFVLDALGLDEAWYGAFLLCGAVGALLAATVVGRLKVRLGAGTAMAAANLVGPLSLVTLGVVPLVLDGGAAIAVAAVCVAVSFGSTTVWNVLVMSLRQAVIPGPMLGRVHGTWRTLLWGVMPLGSVLGGLLARGGLSLPLVVAGGLAAAAAALGFRFLAGLPNPEDVHDDPPAAPPADPPADSPTDSDPRDDSPR
ncbi:Na+/melibiose symporter-like transporter [Sediminihabitans luteus]|uniref:Na+/melibiose symporter-like transporter n=1 Tax=Sediminihabitans luteus TaxID=1138585 RepID=A0A2M9D0I5_9CELL|nr:MFS transporter [Sediminihabitans luteus]PJJ77704.1 Na+/melibiose symporter-like transporter [Sediminihabitans luteus]GIJ00069.1 MFS transporter [Sediminihabitans luteus]